MSFADLLAGCVRLICGTRPLHGKLVPEQPAIYFANHSSHLDFVIIWAGLPKKCRDRVRPVAGRDYWEKSPLRRWLARRVFQAVLIERQKVTVKSNPLQPMLAALDHGNSLIVFPEGTRSPDGIVHEFKSGLYHLARARPHIPLVPIYLENLNRILPKGDFLPVPLIATLFADEPLFLGAEEIKSDFLHRARATVTHIKNRSIS